ncbi:MAG: hypothetical protein A2381_14450 [Bdellovibrionales bacterium RIFOXYB1_FULL_37_110]|nr:MAG: hypothetical protein A2417_03110 [Bdellovibrionales bacterium RIFOXYC1_FULL_37_79]OFZ58340.1 MAG: hypothetical protein A2381_14450 [Bdellovibrionales bacterium RIFOXYB1_FULL_37_110]
MDTRPLYERVILVGSTARKAGKTTYVTNFLKTNKGRFIAIKIQTSLKYEKFEIFKEAICGLENDTQKYLKSGAKDAYLINAPADKIMEAFMTLYKSIDPSSPIICESTSLIKYIKPKKFILFYKIDAKKNKPDVDLFISMADEIIKIS